MLICLNAPIRGKAERPETLEPGVEKAKGDLITVYKYLKYRSQVSGSRLFSAVCSNRTRGSGEKLEHKKFHTSMKNFTVRVRKC